MQYNTVLNLDQFADGAFAALMRDVFAHFAQAFANYPSGYEVCKAWEITQAVRAFRDFGVLHDQAEVLGVAAGFEHTVYYLTNFVKRVFSTDLYETNEHWQEANGAMLFKPEQFAVQGMAWKPRRLVVQHMDALDLRYEDASFDGLFSSGSIEHFGTLENVALAAAEMGRVLKPGGILALSTEFRIAGPADQIGVPGTIIFTPEMLLDHVVGASGLELVDQPDFIVSAATAQEAYPLQEAIDSGIRARSIGLIHDGFTWTSVSLCLRKPK